MGNCIGQVTHYYAKIGVAVLELTAGLKLHNTIQILGHSTDLIQKVYSLEVNHHKVQFAESGSEVALKVDEPVRKGDKVFLITDDVFLDEGMNRL